MEIAVDLAKYYLLSYLKEVVIVISSWHRDWRVSVQTPRPCDDHTMTIDNAKIIIMGVCRAMPHNITRESEMKMSFMI